MGGKKGGLTSLELCAGAGGQAIGLEQAGLRHVGLVEIEPQFCATLRTNRPQWNTIQDDVRSFKRQASRFRGVDVVAGGLPCPPFSVAGKQLGELDERNLFPDALDIIEVVQPKAVMIENVRGFLDSVFADYRDWFRGRMKALGYQVDWRLLNASDFGVPQLRPRVVIVGIRSDYASKFKWDSWATPSSVRAPTVGEALFDLMGANGWKGVRAWRDQASDIAPTIVGGSKKHGGPDLGPTRAKAAWMSLGVDAKTIAESAPARDFVGLPRLTVEMVARLQGFPPEWRFVGGKTASYRQVGNAFPPPVARSVASRIVAAIVR